MVARRAARRLGHTAVVVLGILDPKDADWPRHVDDLRTRLGAPHNPSLFPPHFLKATFPKIGGRIALYGGGAAFPFPPGPAAYTAPYHGAPPPPPLHAPPYAAGAPPAYPPSRPAGAALRIGLPP